MKRETKLLEGLVIASLVTLLTVSTILRPSALSVAALAVSCILSIAVVRQLLKSPNPSNPFFSSSRSLMAHNWRSQNEDREKLVDRIVLAVEDIITNTRDNGESFDEIKIKQELRQRLGYVVKEESGVPVGGQNIEATIVLSDLRGFSFMTQGCSAQEVVDMLNRYFTRMCEIIYHYGGKVDKFMGDSIMALFGVPGNSGKEIEHAVCCAAQMQIAMDSYNKENEKFGMPNLYMGIGINTGEVVVGKIGSDLHSEYTVIGDQVNLTSRIEAHTLRGQILISQNTYERIKDLIHVREPIYISVKGKSEPVPLYELLSIGGPYNLQVPDREARRSRRVDVDIPFKFQVCEGRIVRSDTYDGRILNISSGGMFASTPAHVEPYSNIKFRLKVHILGVESNDIYGTILRTQRSVELYEMNVEFTMIGPRDRNVIKEMVDRIVGGSFSPS